MDIGPSYATDAGFDPNGILDNEYGLFYVNGTLITGQNLVRGAVVGQIIASGKYTLALSASSDGSQVPKGIMVADTDATSGDATCSIYTQGGFITNKLTFGAGITAAAVRDACASKGLFLKDAVPA